MTFIRELYGDMKPMGRLMLYLGLGTLVAAAAMSVDFGWSVSIKHAVYLGMLTIVVAIIPDVAHHQWKEGNRAVAIILAAICIPLFAIEFGSHAGYTAGLRGSNVSEATVQNTKYDDNRQTVADNRSNLEMWKAQLAKLTTDNAWAATTKAEGLRAQLDSAQKAIDLETAKGGCKTKCLDRMKEKAQIEERIAIAERATDLTARIEATQRLVDKAKEKSADTEFKVSSVDHQNKFYTKTVALFAKGTVKASDLLDAQVDQTVNLGMALAGTGLPALCFFVAGLYRNRSRDDDHDDPTAHVGEQIKAPMRAADIRRTETGIPPVEARYAPPQDSIMLGLIDDKEGMRQLVSRLRGDARIAHRLA